MGIIFKVRWDSLASELYYTPSSFYLMPNIFNSKHITLEMISFIKMQEWMHQALYYHWFSIECLIIIFSPSNHF